MNRIYAAVILFACIAYSSMGETPRVAVLNFDTKTGRESGGHSGLVPAKAVAAKGAYVLSRILLDQDEFTLVDRRDFTTQLEKLSHKELGNDDPRPTFIHAAQMLNADAVLRGTLLVYSTGAKKVRQGGHAADLSTLSLRVSIRALDAIDGSVLAIGSGVSQKDFRQTENVKISIGEEEVFLMLEDAVRQSVPDLKKGLTRRLQKKEKQDTVLLTVESTDDPALVEIDGALVGTTPLKSLEVYSGDHVLSVSRPGYETITKRIVLEEDSIIKAPMLKTDLTVKEKKEILEKADMRMYLTSGRPDILIQTIK